MIFPNKDTMLFGSFSSNPGNQGCERFNSWFKRDSINAIYKSFKVTNVDDLITSVKTLDFKGFALSMPLKVSILDFSIDRSTEVDAIGAANTVVNIDGYLKAYNTDYIAIKEYLQKYYGNIKGMFILGDGGYAKACIYACSLLNINYITIDRTTWDLLETINNSLVFNCTPVKGLKEVLHESNSFIDCDPTTESGEELSLIQAKAQYELYKSTFK